jgi:hypothetical protein
MPSFTLLLFRSQPDYAEFNNFALRSGQGEIPAKGYIALLADFDEDTPKGAAKALVVPRIGDVGEGVDFAL